MANKQTLITFHQVREQCQQASADGWRAFFNLYGPLVLQLLAIYGLGDSSAWERTVDTLAKDDFERLHAMAQQTEREFLMELRGDLLERASAEMKGDQATSDHLPEGASDFGLEQISGLLEGLPLLHQEIVWFKMAGYTNATIERILRVTPEVARTALDRLASGFDAVGALTQDRCPWPRKWMALTRAARTLKKEDCPTLHQLLRIHDGQVSWYDKEPVEKRVSSCRHCLENWTGLREVAYWRRAAPAVSPELVEQWLKRIPIKETRKKYFFQRASR